MEILEWLSNHADYEAIVDGANVALCRQNFAAEQPDTALRELNAIRGKWPLVILYNKRYRMLMEVLIGSCLKLGKLKECSLLQKDLTVIYTTRLKGAKDLSAQRREPECMLMYDVVYCWRLWS